MLKKITILEALNKCMTTIKEYIGLVADKKVDKVEGKCLTTNDLTDQLVENYNTAYNHSQEPHAPSNAQKNSDITKAEIEAKLTGQIDTHFHDLSEDLSEYDRRLDVSENKIENINQEITNTIKPTLNTHETKLNNIEAINTEQNNRLESIEVKNQEQDNRINALETNDKIQDLNIKALFTTSDIMDIEEEGNSLPLHNSKRGFAIIDEIKGNTLVNCNKEPDKELILNGDINISGDNTVTITEGVDGGLVDVALEGNTLVNVSKTKDITTLPLDEELTYLYANTKYTVQFISDVATTADITLGGTSLLEQSIVAGLNRISITTPATLADNKLVISGVGANISKVVVTDTNRQFGYFEGMKSVGECEGNIEILSRNKNEINISPFTNSFTNTNFTSYNVTLPIMGKTFSYRYDYEIISISEEQDSFKTNLLGSTYANPTDAIADFDLTTVNQRLYNGAKGTVVVNNISSTKAHTLMEIRCIRTTTPVTMTYKITNFALYFNDNADIYTPHQSNTQQLTHEPLRAVGEVKDRYVLIDGKWYIERNCGEVVFDGSDDEQITIYPVREDGFTSFLLNAEEINGITNYFSNVICDVLPSDYTKAYDIATKPNIYKWVDDSVNFVGTLEGNNIDVRQWLRQNHTTIVYPLAAQVYEPIDYNPFEVYNEVTHISANSTIPCNVTVKNHGYNCILKPSTTYTISSNLGLNTVTTGADIGDSCLRFMDTDTSDVTTMRDVLVLEGDWTSKADLIPGFFAGMESCYEQKKITDEHDEHFGYYEVNAKVVGKNLFDKGARILGRYINNSVSNYSIAYNNDYDILVIPIINSTNVVVKNNNGNKFYIARWEDLNGNLILGDEKAYEKSEAILTPPRNNCVLKICISKTNVDDNIQIEQGAEATPYEPYKESTIKFYIKDPLRGIGEVKDKVFVEDGKVKILRNCASVTLDGSDDENLSKTGTDYDSINNISFSLDNNNNNITSAWTNPKAILSSSLSSVGHRVWEGQQEGITSDTTKIILCLNRAKLQTQDLNGFKQWLQQNPTTVVCQLAEPFIEEVEYFDSKLYMEIFNNSTLFYNSNIPVTSKVHYSYSVPLVDKVSQTANISDEQDQLIIDMAVQVSVLEIMTL